MRSDIDIQCYETCVFCRNSFGRVRQFLRHRCKAKERGDDNAKEFYVRERCAQLRRYAAEKLDQVLAWDKKSHGRTKKRGHEAVDGCSELHQPAKVHLVAVDGDTNQWFPAENDLLGNNLPSNKYVSRASNRLCHRSSISKQSTQLHAADTDAITLKRVCNSIQQLIQCRVINAVNQPHARVCANL